MDSSRDHSTGEPEDDTAARTPITDQPFGYESYYNSKSLSDITICYGDRVFYGHRILLCGFSHWFRAAFTGEFKESHTKEITLHDDDPDTLEFMFSMAYTNDVYELPDPPLSEPLDQAHFYVELYKTFDKYQTQDTHGIFSSRFYRSISNYLAHIEMEDAYNIDAFCELVQEVYVISGDSTEHPILHDLLWCIMGSNGHVLSEGHSTIVRKLLKETSARIVNFGRDMFTFMVDRIDEQKCQCARNSMREGLQCYRCGGDWWSEDGDIEDEAQLGFEPSCSMLGFNRYVAEDVQEDNYAQLVQASELGVQHRSTA